MHLAESPVKIQLRGTAGTGTGPDLTGYPHLTYAPSQWGPGVRMASNGSPVELIAREAVEAMDILDRLSRREGVSLGELFDALRYADANGSA